MGADNHITPAISTPDLKNTERSSLSGEVDPIEAPSELVDSVNGDDAPVWRAWLRRNGAGWKLPVLVHADTESEALEQAEEIVQTTANALGIPWECDNLDEIEVLRLIV